MSGEAAGRGLPALDVDALAPTRAALHAYARVLGAWLERCRPRRKHWWHASLRPTLGGLGTGVVYGPVDAAIELDLAESILHVRTGTGDRCALALRGQSAEELAAEVGGFLTDRGLPGDLAPPPAEDAESTVTHPGYSRRQAGAMGAAFGVVAGAMSTFRAGIAQETSPIQIWPHHFDLSMIWLPGEKIPGEDPGDEERSDKQMNFGFAFGDASVREPYCYVTAYPSPDALARHPLPAGTAWVSEGFNGAVLTWRQLAGDPDPQGYLLALWRGLLDAGRTQLLSR